MEIDADNVIINPKEYVLGSKISDILEKRVMQCFLCVRTQLQDLIRLSYRHVSADSIDILYSEQLITSIQGFLKNGLGFVDILETRKDEPFIDTVLGNLIQVIRCALIAPLSAKYGLSEDACNRLAHEFNFESRLIKSVSKTTRYHLSELEKPCEEMFKATKLGNKSHHFPGRSFVFIAYPLRKDIQAVLREFERVIYCAGRIASTMKKMLYEISGYLYRSVIKEEADMKKMQVAIPALLRESIMAIDGVFGIGTIYGQLEVHLKNMEHEREAVVQRKVCEMINNFKFTQPYRVVRVLQEPEKFCFETGYHIEYLRDVAFHLSGTLGGFVYDGDGNLYGLTCAHAQQYVLIKNGIFPNDDNRSLIDIAAVKVLGNIQQRCSINLKDEDGKKKPTELCKPTELYTKAPNEIVTEQAYKYGAGSNLTKGIICSADFTIRLGRAESDHLVLIDCLPGSDDGPYATEGDSGSITCITDVGKHAVKIKAVSMLCHGRYLIDDSELCVTFLLRKGLEKLQKSAGVELILPADKS
ncbi:uncharacterized protein LOC128553018 [Mercenaria mercenaria]|uniref:uncharacterized protein LOC128553018 n=1 Tax=Mercenaria mercenaria TaxID=6596 RepID=UPI00234F0C8A|nr:uncharacterized protein LOC128553018 [Mercenaria mercenaria]